MTWSARAAPGNGSAPARPSSGRPSAGPASARSATSRSSGSTGPGTGPAGPTASRPARAARRPSTISASRSGPAAGTTSTPSATSACRASRRSPAGSTRRAYRSRLWTMRMFAGFGAAEDTNARFRQLLDAGQTGLSIAFDMPTLYGYDTDDPEAEGEFGTCGVAVSSLADMEVLLGRPAARADQHVDDDQLAGRPDLGDVHRRRREARRAPARPRGHPPERHPQGVRGPEGVPVPARATRSGWSPTRSSSGPASCPAGTRSRSAATTSARPARRRSRSWPSRSPTGWPTSRSASGAACGSTTSPRA